MNTPTGPEFTHHTVVVQPVRNGFELHHGYVWRNQKFTQVSYFKSRSGAMGRAKKVRGEIGLGA
ncbi:MAG: hypothetical protein EOP83_35075 [Verrucomicrobiaceae bacterium]|nr:MAG: hypothetical protein EOP83_35075 [Verrucomicrobiaceae bacterium]